MQNRGSGPGGVFEQIAAQYGVSVSEVIRDIQEAVDAAWNNEDRAIRAKQRQLFPKGKPSAEEFIRVMAKQADK